MCILYFNLIHMYMYKQVYKYTFGEITYSVLSSSLQKNLLLPNRCTMKHRFSYSRLRPNFERQYIFTNTQDTNMI